jgi:DNA-binding PadR family transcriptional regulator
MPIQGKPIQQQPAGELADLGRFSESALLVLASLAEGPKHGYAMMQDILEFHGARMEPGTLYGVLARLELRGWISPLPVEGRRRPYRLTPDGAEVLQAHLTVMERVVSTGRQRLEPHGSAATQ